MANDQGESPQSGSQKISAADLQKIQINLRSAHDAIGQILTSSDRVRASAAAVFDRGFDRTSPGFDRYYDRDRNMEDLKSKVINPVINPVNRELGGLEGNPG